jgi:hypothetical protein
MAAIVAMLDFVSPDNVIRCTVFIPVRDALCMDYGPFAITPDVISNQPTFTT